MTTIRPFSNTDPVFVSTIWNQRAKAEPKHFALVSPELLEEHIFGNVLFDPQGLLLASQDGALVGFIHASFLPNQSWTGVSPQAGIIYTPIVLPDVPDYEGICTALIQAAENYLKSKGIQIWCLGGCEKTPPFYTGLIGNGIPTGLFDDEKRLQELILKLGYKKHMRFEHLRLNVHNYSHPTNVQIYHARNNYIVRRNDPPIARNWWEANVYRNFMTFEWNVYSNSNQHTPIAGALIHQLALPCSCKMAPSQNLLLSDIGVSEVLTHHGIGSFLLLSAIHDILNITGTEPTITTTIIDNDARLSHFLKKHCFCDIGKSISYFRRDDA